MLHYQKIIFNSFANELYQWVWVYSFCLTRTDGKTCKCTQALDLGHIPLVTFCCECDYVQTCFPASSNVKLHFFPFFQMEPRLSLLITN